MKQVLLFCALIWGGYAHALTINFSPSCTETYLDCYIDMSDGTYAFDGSNHWVQNDGIYAAGQNYLGWQLQASISNGYGLGSLLVFAPEQFERGFCWLGDYAWFNQTPNWSYYNGFKVLGYGLWDGTTPDLTKPPEGRNLVVHVSWNVPEISSTFALLGIGLLGLVALRRKSAARR